MEIVTDITDLRSRIAAWRRQGERIALVATMGNLHAGHLELVRQAAGHADRVVVSIFVNPMQFSAGEDFESYPRTPDQDLAALDACKVDLLFMPAAESVYPAGIEGETRVSVPVLGDILCGRHRPGHFAGVATVVAKLFNLVQPDVAVFGEKDYQQLLVIRHMARDLCFPIDIVGVPTVRESDGLAMSSRNRYLSDSERAAAAGLNQVLQQVVASARSGAEDLARIEQAAQAQLAARGFRPDYVSIRCSDNLAVPSAGDTALVVLGAAWLGPARLIDNIVFQRT